MVSKGCFQVLPFSRKQLLTVIFAVQGVGGRMARSRRRFRHSWRKHVSQKQRGQTLRQQASAAPYVLYLDRTSSGRPYLVGDRVRQGLPNNLGTATLRHLHTSQVRAKARTGCSNRSYWPQGRGYQEDHYWPSPLGSCWWIGFVLG